MASNYGLNEQLEKTETSDLIVYDGAQFSDEKAVEMLDEAMIKLEEPDEETPQVEMNWVDEYSQEALTPRPSTSREVRKYKKNRAKKESPSSTFNDSADDQRIREMVNMNCEYCFEDLINFREAKIHYKEQHDVEGYFKCCGRKFKQKCRLIDHVNSHYDLAYNCTFCEKGFNSRSYLMKHMACHEVDKQFVSFSVTHLNNFLIYFNLEMRSLPKSIC